MPAAAAYRLDPLVKRLIETSAGRVVVEYDRTFTVGLQVGVTTFDEEGWERRGADLDSEAASGPRRDVSSVSPEGAAYPDHRRGGPRGRHRGVMARRLGQTLGASAGRARSRVWRSPS